MRSDVGVRVVVLVVVVAGGADAGWHCWMVEEVEVLLLAGWCFLDGGGRGRAAMNEVPGERLAWGSTQQR
jgi:hypothetical protein